MSLRAALTIYRFQIARTWRTSLQSVVAPVLSTTLYFVVFGSALGPRIAEIDGIGFGAFIVPGLVMLSLLTQSVSNASFAIYFPRFTGTIFELLSAPISPVAIVASYVCAAASKSVLLAVIILATASLFVPLRVTHPGWMILFMLLTVLTFSLLGFIIGVWADNFEKLQLVPLLVITPLTFLGGSFYSISMLPEFWRNLALLNPVVYLVSAFRWSFYDISDIPIATSFTVAVCLLALFLGTAAKVFRTGCRLRV